jgi:GDP-L-fucose synthase
MHPSAKIYVAGHRGLAGSAIARALATAGYNNVITRTHAELDLIDQKAVRDFFEREKPEYVFLAAARVGGILANNTYPAEFIHQNLSIETNVIHECWRSGVRRLLFLGSSCVYPAKCPQPIKEEYLLTGPLEPTNRPYAVAKIAGIEMCWSYNRQYGTRYLAMMPTNLYGPGDNYDLETAHVLAALLRKFHEAKEKGQSSVVVWGSGTPRREFLHSADMADAALFLITLPENLFQELTAPERLPVINVGAGKDITIRELAELIADVVGYRGDLVFDRSKPDGTPQKLLDVGFMTSVGWQAKTGLRDGTRLAYQSMLAG